MRVVKRKNKKALLIAILALSLAILIAGAILLDTLLKVDEGGDTKPVLPELIEGEAIYNNTAVAYPRVAEKDIIFVDVLGTEGNKYSLIREKTEKDGKSTYGNFILSYTVTKEDGTEEDRVYAPGIITEDPNTDYSDLYSIENEDGYGTIPKLTYLCTAVGTLYFHERIELSSDEAESQAQLAKFGLTKSNTVTIGFTYVDSDGNEKRHTVRIGSSVVTGFGHYYLVDDRPYVYSVENNNYFNYALADFTTFVKPMLVAEGLDIDRAFEPYLTTGFEQWKNTLYDDNDPYNEDGVYDGVVDNIKDDATVTVNASLVRPKKSEANGYSKGGVTGVNFDLTETYDDEIYKYTLSALKGKPLGALTKNLYVTMMDYASTGLLDNSKLADGIEYNYSITHIESVIEPDGEHADAGYAVGNAKYVKVTYTARIGNAGETVGPLHAVINMEDAVLPAAAKSEISGSQVGKLDTPISFTVNYTEENSINRSIVITEIITILNDKGKAVEKVADGCRVMFRYKYEINGVVINNYATAVITVSDSLEGTDKEIAETLMGMSQSRDLSIKINDGKYQLMHSFISYEISELCYFITRENVVSFRFQQASQRNPYYGESLYENTTKGKYSMYALNATACESVVKMLGGIGANASASVGLWGIKTVAVGLTPEVIKEFKLYAYSVYFELPRGITTVKLGEGSVSDDYLNELDDYTYYSTLGFNLYVSEKFKDSEDGKWYRYVGSDLYDVVALCPAETFEFLEYGFIDFYARRNVMLTDIVNIQGMKFDFLMSDIYGSYDNEFTHDQLYAFNGKVYPKSVLVDLFGEDALATATKYEAIDISVTPSGECMDTEFSKFLTDKGYTYSSLYEFFDKETVELDSLGTSNFKELTELIFYTYYEGYFETEEERKDAFENSKKLMVMTVTLGKRDSDGDYQTYGAYDYVYEFYRATDRRVAVKLYRQNRETNEVIDEVADFYISTFSFKKIVNAYVSILNKELISNDTPYGS